MIRLRVERSPIRQFLAGLAGLVLILAAMDVIWLHRVSGPPAANEDGTLTSRGIVDRRTDVLWGSLLLVSGSVVLIGAMAGLAIRRPVVELTDEELRIRVGGGPRSGNPLGVVAIPWAEVVSVRSATDESEGWQPMRVLIIGVDHPGALPAEPWGGVWVGDELHLDADGWQVPPEEVAMRADLLMRRHRGRPDVRDSAP